MSTVHVDLKITMKYKNRDLYFLHSITSRCMNIISNLQVYGTQKVIEDREDKFKFSLFCFRSYIYFIQQIYLLLEMFPNCIHPIWSGHLI